MRGQITKTPNHTYREKKMSENEVKWHPYPKEKPKREGVYLVTLKDEEVTSDWFNSGYFRFYVDDVIAWAELPEPYRPKVKNEIHE